MPFPPHSRLISEEIGVRKLFERRRVITCISKLAVDKLGASPSSSNLSASSSLSNLMDAAGKSESPPLPRSPCDATTDGGDDGDDALSQVSYVHQRWLDDEDTSLAATSGPPHKVELVVMADDVTRELLVRKWYAGVHGGREFAAAVAARWKLQGLDDVGA
jgi:hypothetical protein